MSRVIPLFIWISSILVLFQVFIQCSPPPKVFSPSSPPNTSFRTKSDPHSSRSRGGEKLSARASQSPSSPTDLVVQPLQQTKLLRSRNRASSGDFPMGALPSGNLGEKRLFIDEVDRRDLIDSTMYQPASSREKLGSLSGHCTPKGFKQRKKTRSLSTSMDVMDRDQDEIMRDGSITGFENLSLPFILVSAFEEGKN